MDKRPCHADIRQMMSAEQMEKIFAVLLESMGHEYAEVKLIVKRGKVRFVQLTTATDLKDGD